MKTRKITLATVKSFIRKNRTNLLINVKSEFDGMIDGKQIRNDGFIKATETDKHFERTLGISRAWFVGDSIDYFTAFENETLTGIEVSNCCGHFILAIEK